jgi:hypothetical protein
MSGTQTVTLTELPAVVMWVTTTLHTKVQAVPTSLKERLNHLVSVSASVTKFMTAPPVQQSQ